jgi:hypothetical protein
MDPQPAMPANRAQASPEAIARYNAWAERNDQPYWVVPGAAPAAKAQPKRRGRPGLPLPAQPAHGAVQDGAEGGGWRRGTFWKNRTEYAKKADGTVRKLRTFNSRTGEYTRFPAFTDYYSHNRQKFIINVPCVGYIPPEKTRNGIEQALLGYLGGQQSQPNQAAEDADEEGSANDVPLLRSTFYGAGHTRRIIPLTPESVGAINAPRALQNLSNLGVVRDEDHSQEDIETALQANVPILLRNLPRVNTVDGLKRKVAIESTIVWVWDESQPITFDEQIFRHLHSDEEPLIETLLDRPLLGLPYIDELMYGREGLSKIACADLTDRGGCVVAQIVELVSKRVNKKIPVPGGQQGGKDKGIQMQVQVPRFTPEQVTAEFDIIFAELFPGEAVDENDLEAGLVEAQRPYPYQFADWREVGITTRMVSLFCDRQKIALRVLY